MRSKRRILGPCTLAEFQRLFAFDRIRWSIRNSRRLVPGRGKNGHRQFFGRPEHGDVRLRDFRRYPGGSQRIRQPGAPTRTTSADERQRLATMHHVCPANNPPTTGQGVVVTGTATTTGNGSPASFEAKGASTVQVCITGGSTTPFSNLSLVYTGPATSHFGPQAIHGVVSRVSAK